MTYIYIRTSRANSAAGNNHISSRRTFQNNIFTGVVLKTVKRLTHLCGGNRIIIFRTQSTFEWKGGEKK